MARRFTGEKDESEMAHKHARDGIPPENYVLKLFYSFSSSRRKPAAI